MIRPNSEDKILDLCLRVEKLEADNSGLRLLVKDLMFEVQALKIKSPYHGKVSTHITSTGSANEKASRANDKSTNNSAQYNKPQKRRENQKETRNVLTPSNSIQQYSMTLQLNPKTTPKAAIKPLSKIEQYRPIGGLSSSNSKAVPRRTVNSSPNGTTLHRSITETKKSLGSFLFNEWSTQKVVNIEKLEPSYHNSPSRNQKIPEMVAEEDELQNVQKVQFQKSYCSVGPTRQGRS